MVENNNLEVLLVGEQDGVCLKEQRGMGKPILGQPSSEFGFSQKKGKKPANSGGVNEFSNFVGLSMKRSLSTPCV